VSASFCKHMLWKMQHVSITWQISSMCFMSRYFNLRKRPFSKANARSTMHRVAECTKLKFLCTGVSLPLSRYGTRSHCNKGYAASPMINLRGEHTFGPYENNGEFLNTRASCTLPGQPAQQSIKKHSAVYNCLQ